MPAIQYVVMRDCCTSGHCFACADAAPIRIEQFRTTSKALAERVAINWASHNATITEER